MMNKVLIATARSANDLEFPSTVREKIGKLQAGNIIGAQKLFRSELPEVVLLDIDLFPHSSGDGFKQCFDGFWRINPHARFIIISSKNNSRLATKAIEAGATSYLILPATLEQIQAEVKSVAKHQGNVLRSGSYLAPDVSSGYTTMLKTRSESMKRMLEKVALVSKTETTVLLTGETGTGKGVVARLIHDSSGRASKTMLNVHCGAIPDSLIESELFGHEKGSFTGAIRTQKGKFEQASGGTIFLDEIGTITAATQIKLLQVLQDRSYQSVGSHKTQTTDVRIIAASNSNLEEMANLGDFRSDLYYRLNVFPIEVPPLQKRKEDITLFINFFIEQLNLKHNKMISGVTPDVMQVLEDYHWPGNVRELENLMQRAYILCNSSHLDRTAFPTDLFKKRSEQTTGFQQATAPWETLAEFRQKAANKAEKEYLCSVLSAHSGKINATSETAGVSRRQIHKLLTKHGIKKEDFKKRSGGW